MGSPIPYHGSTALNAPPGYMTLYATLFSEGNFRLPMSKFLGEILTKYCIHISQVNALGLPRVTHFEFICRAQKLVPTVEMFNIFYYVTYSRTTNVLPCSRDPPKSFHDWKNKFFYIREGVIPIDMYYRVEHKGVPKVVLVDSCDDCAGSGIKPSQRFLPRFQLGEKALVAAGMSLLWVPRDPRAALVYAYKGKRYSLFVVVLFFSFFVTYLFFVLVRYSLMNVFDPEIGGEMTGMLLPAGEAAWVDRIRDTFYIPLLKVWPLMVLLF
ncbi:hypothetical protein HanPI659440_Chr03g0098411 [Helianthus annuus]|nr:hypothetical protein HanPI659440_Chr03g0098411 [Helianthus annuus]